MGVVANIKHDQFPTQGELVGKRVKVIFHYDTSNSVEGVCRRDDRDAPGQLIFELDDGRLVCGTECQWQPLD